MCTLQKLYLNNKLLEMASSHAYGSGGGRSWAWSLLLEASMLRARLNVVVSSLLDVLKLMGTPRYKF